MIYKYLSAGEPVPANAEIKVGNIWVGYYSDEIIPYNVKDRCGINEKVRVPIDID